MSTKLTEQDKDSNAVSHPDTDYADTKADQVPVDNDEPVDEPDPVKADSDEQLQKDDADAIDESNIVGKRTRGGKPAQGAMREPGDEEGIPTDE